VICRTLIEFFLVKIILDEFVKHCMFVTSKVLMLTENHFNFAAF